MNICLLCVIVAAGAQGWERPEINASELAAPGAYQQQSAQPTRTPNNANAANDSWDMDTPSLEETPRTPTAQPVYWEYDEEGRPVARPMQDAAAPRTETQQPPEVKKEPTEPVQDAAERSVHHAGRIATFWMVLPRR